MSFIIKRFGTLTIGISWETKNLDSNLKNLNSTNNQQNGREKEKGINIKRREKFYEK